MSSSCGCCLPDGANEPRTNRPQLPAVVYRLGTFSSFRREMLESLGAAPGLAGWTSRAGDDYGVTLIELSAALFDLLSFYQERYANEVFLGTARFSDSVDALVALLGYRRRPGLAARTTLAFTLDAGKKVSIPVGLAVQSVPDGKTAPQTFETLEALEADARFNRLRLWPEPVTANPLAQGRTRAALDRVEGARLAAALAANDTLVLWNHGTGDLVEEKKIAAVKRIEDRAVVVFSQPVERSTWTAASRAAVFRRTFRLFGANAPEQYMVASTTPQGRIQWQLHTLGASQYDVAAGLVLNLSGKVEGLEVGQKLLVADNGTGGVKTRVTVTSISHREGTLGSLTETYTRLGVDPDGAGDLPAIADRRRVTVYELTGPTATFWTSRYPTGWSEPVAFLPGLRRETPEGGAIELERRFVGRDLAPGVVLRPAELEKGRTLLLADGSGELVEATVQATPTLEPAMGVAGTFCHLRIPLEVEEGLDLDPATAVLLGNVAPASHGETVALETLGSGDATAPFQRFDLDRSPLTWLADESPEGRSSTLTVRVGGVAWRPVPTLFGQPPNAPVYELRTTDDGGTLVQFGNGVQLGDGVTGARLPTGRSNVTASYRKGGGLAGRVPVGSLTTLLSRPPGLSGVVNPAAAEGGADPESPEELRTNGPGSVRTFGRVVSLEDVEHFTLASGEIAKARATWVWDGLDRAVHVTVAAALGASLSAGARRDLGERLAAAGDPHRRYRVDNYLPVSFEVSAGLGVDPAYQAEAVLAAARATAEAALSFDAQQLGRPLHLSDLFRILQAVPGVVFVDVDRFLFKRPLGLTNPQFHAWLAARGVTFLAFGVPAPVQGHLRFFTSRPAPGGSGALLAAELPRLAEPAVDLELTERQVPQS